MRCVPAAQRETAILNCTDKMKRCDRMAEIQEDCRRLANVEGDWRKRDPTWRKRDPTWRKSDQSWRKSEFCSRKKNNCFGLAPGLPVPQDRATVTGPGPAGHYLLSRVTVLPGQTRRSTDTASGCREVNSRVTVSPAQTAQLFVMWSKDGSRIWLCAIWYTHTSIDLCRYPQYSIYL